jgi:hypothetical protein
MLSVLVDRELDLQLTQLMVETSPSWNSRVGALLHSVGGRAPSASLVSHLSEEQGVPNAVPPHGAQRTEPGLEHAQLSEEHKSD